MEFFNKANVVKLRTHLDKYLIADDDQENVRQSRHGGAAPKSRWSVELVPEKPHLVRLKSCHGRYLTASEVPFLLGMTGKKVLQTSPEKMSDWAIDWEPIRDGFGVKLRSWSGKYLRANGGPPPWRNSVTHDEPHTAATQKWVLWGVEVAEAGEAAAEWLSDYSSAASSFSSVSEDVLGFGSASDSAMSVVPIKSPRLSVVWSKSPRLYAEETNYAAAAAAMELFHNAKAVRLKGHHEKYLLAHENEESVIQDRNGSSKNAHWTVEPVPGSDSFIRLKSAYNKYLTASNQPFLLGMTGNKVLQTLPRRPDSSVEWEPVRVGSQVKLKTRYGQFLRANGGLPPWRNSVTHDIPQRTATQDWVLWDVDIVEIQVQSPAGKPTAFAPEVKYSDFGGSESNFPAPKPTASAPPVMRWDSMGSESGSPYSVSINSAKFSRQESSDFYAGSPPKSEGRTIYYHIADENGEVDDESTVGYPLTFRGNGVEELTQKLEEETGIKGIVVCTRSPLNKKLYPLHLRLPPNNTTMHVVIVQSLETGA